MSGDTAVKDNVSNMLLLTPWAEIRLAKTAKEFNMDKVRITP